MSHPVVDDLSIAFVLWLVAIPLVALAVAGGRGRATKSAFRLAVGRFLVPLMWLAIAFGALGAGALVGERKGVAVAAVGVVFVVLGLVAVLAREQHATTGQKAHPPR